MYDMAPPESIFNAEGLSRALKRPLDSRQAISPRPRSAEIELYADGVKVATTAAVASGDWAFCFTDLPKYEDGAEIDYTIAEDDVDEYTGEIDGFTVTNTHEPETVNVSVLKVWDDANDVDHIRPDHVDVKLFADGDEIKLIRLSEVDGWTAEVEDLAKYADGEEIEYTWEEYDLPEGYTLKSAETDEDGLTTITNAHEPETTSATVTKVWEDDENSQGKRPESVTVKLLANNIETGTEVELSESNRWTATVEGLAVYGEDGDRISYSWIEDTEALPDGYSIQSIETDEANGVVETTITNVYKPEYKYLTVTKMWEDSNDQDG